MYKDVKNMDLNTYNTLTINTLLVTIDIKMVKNKTLHKLRFCFRQSN